MLPLCYESPSFMMTLILRVLFCCYKFLNNAFTTGLLSDGVARIFFLTPMPQHKRKDVSGFEPTTVSRVAPDWDLSDALPTALQRRGI